MFYTSVPLRGNCVWVTQKIKGRVVTSLQPFSLTSLLCFWWFSLACLFSNLSSHLLAPPPPSFAHQHRGYAALPNSESAGPGWDPSCCTAPSERCPGGTAAREGGSPHRSSMWLCRSLPPGWRSAFWRRRWR